MKKLLLILVTILTVASVQAQQQDRTEYFKEGDTVTVCRVNGNTRTYLTVNNRGEITSHNEPNDDALWVISHGTYQTFNWGDQDQYSFQHLKTDKYLHANITRRGNNYTTKLELGDNASLFVENNPEGENNKYTNVSEMHYNYPNGNSTVSFHLTVDNRGTWSLKQNSATSLQIEKWTKHSEASFNAYFSPENYDFKLAKTNDEALAQTKQVRFVFDLVDESYLKCNNNSTTKQLLHTSNSESDLNVLKDLGIIPTFSWKSSETATSTLTRSNYTATAEQSDRVMMKLSGTGDDDQYQISEDTLAWEVRITPVGASPMGLMKENYNDVLSYTNYVDYLEAKWSYGNKDYSATARIVRKSYRVEDLPIFEFTSNPSTFTFPGQDNNETPESELQQTFKIHGYHQHGTAYYDVDGNLVEKNITYGPDGKPVKMPLRNHYQDGEVILNYTLKFQYKDGENWVDEEDYDADWIQSPTVNEGDTTITISTTQNTGTYRQARLVGTINVYKNQSGTEEHQHSGEFIIPINQRSTSGQAITFNNYDGASYKDADKDNDLLNGRQQVHTAERTIYYTPNQDIQLRLAESNFFGYMRWYDFETGCDPQWNHPNNRTTWATQPRGANGQAFKAINTDDNSKGLYGINGEALNQNNENNPSPVLRGWNYTYNASAQNATSGYHTVACDVSAYTDYEIEKAAGNNNRVTAITEPTLSYRQLFHLRPAEEIATKINTLSHLSGEGGESSFLEEYNYMASVGVDVHLATKYRYKSYTGSHESELCYFFFGTGNTLYRIGKDVQAKWYRVENKQEVQITNPTYAAYDYLQVDSDIEKTDTIILKVPSTDLTTFGLQRDLLLARFIIKYVNKNSAGPVASTIITDHEIDDHFIRLETIDFNFKEANPSVVEVENNGKTIRQLDYHLPWEQSSYGYYYPKSYSKLGELSPNRSGQAIPYYGEYFLVNKLEKDWANATAHGGANDFALYVDGTTEPGVVATISTDAIICAGQTLYCSAWFCNPCPTSFDYNSPRNPIFRCNVQGRTRKQNPVGDDTWNDWEDVSVFFVGQLDKGSGWQQVVFPVESEKSYDETRVSIYNFATGGSGNDFMVDDICLFASQLPLASYQAQTNCASDANTESSTAVILRIDYTEFQGRRDQYMYYQIYNNTKDTVINLQKTTEEESAYYHDNSGDVLQKAYGSVLIPRFDMVPVAGNSDGSGELTKIYNTVQEFKDALVDEIQQRKTDAGDSDNYEKSAHGKAYIQTKTNDGKTKWLLYVMHIIPNYGEKEGDDIIVTDVEAKKLESKYLFERYDYILRMANVPEELNAAECNMQTTLHATQATVFDLHKGGAVIESSFLPEAEGLCPNNLYTLHSMIENVMAPTTGTSLQTVRGGVLADWLVGFEFDDVYVHTQIRTEEYNKAIEAAKAAFEAKYRYSRAAIKTALLYDLRRPSTEYDKNCNINATSFEELDINCFQEGVNYYIIKDLCERGLLQLGKRTSTFYLGSQDTVRYWVYPIDGTAKGTIGGTEIELHDCTEPIWVMVSSTYTDEELNISPLTKEQKAELQDEYPTIMSEIPTVRVRASELSDDIISVPIKTSNIDEMPEGDMLEINLGNLGNVSFYNFEEVQTIERPENLEVGQKYTLCAPFPGEQDGCHGMLYFHLLVLPDKVIWEPAAGSYNGWGLDENWRGWDDKNSNGIIDDGEKMSIGFVPIAGSDVIIPTLPDVTLYPYVHDHNHYPMDVNAHPSICNNIYFAPGAHIHNQHLLQYQKAFVDMTIPKGNWYMKSAPLQKMYSGDMYVPHEGTWNEGRSLEEHKPFEVKGFAGSRSSSSAYAFWASYYNQSVKTWYEDGGYIESTSSSFQQSNGLNQPLEVGSGFALWGEGADVDAGKDIVIRLPKQEDTYKSSSGTSVQVPRDGLSHKLAFTATQEGETITPMTITLTNKEESEHFLFGNPTMAYINMHDFLHDNANVLNHTFYRIEGGAWNAETEHTMSENRFLAPMSSVMLETKGKNKQTKLTVQLSPLHLTLTDQQDPFSEENPEIQPIAPRVKEGEKNATSEIMTIYTSTDYAYARTVLATNPAANDYYQVGEDALFVSSGIESSSYVITPLNMYTVAEQVPMMADVRQGISSIPLAILAADGYHTQYMQVAFYLSANWSRECYFCDSKTGQKIRIMDGLVISVEMPLNHEQRYYIEGPDEYIGSNDNPGGGGVTTSTSTLTPMEKQSLNAFSVNSGELVVTASSLMREVKIYDMTGRLIADKVLDLFHNTTSLAAPSGICIVEAILRDGTALHTQTIVR